MTDNTNKQPVNTFSQIIQYQDKSIVSKTILKKSTGNVSVFAFDAGQSLSEHTAPFDAIIHVVDGTAEVMISGVKHNVSAPEFIILPAHKPHAVFAPGRFKMVLTMIKS